MKPYTVILDTGAGSGNLTVQLATQGKRITAIDSEPLALEQLQQKVENKGYDIQIVNGEVSSLSFEDNSFDGVTSMFLLPFVDDYKKYLNEVYRVLKTDGVFSISMWAPMSDPSKKILGLRKEVENKFIENGTLPKYQEDWDSLLETTKIAAKNVDKKNISNETMREELDKIGFKNIKFYLDIAYNSYAYFITAQK